MVSKQGKVSPNGKLGMKVTFVGPWYRRIFKYAELRFRGLIK